MKAPVFFFSSTIFDFRDLRSALKYYLEEQGCQVLASEYCDFEKPVEKNSYDACIDALQSADFCVVFIGNRAGGLFDATTGTTITRREYQEAYRLHQERGLRILVFIRSDVWSVYNDRKRVIKAFAALPQSQDAPADADRLAVVREIEGPSMDKPEQIIAFIEEVARNQEMHAANFTGAPRPTNNWVHQFNTFSDVIDVIKPLVFHSGTKDEAIVRRKLSAELIFNLRQCLIRLANYKYMSYLATMYRALHSVKQHTVLKDESPVLLNERDWSRLRGVVRRPEDISFQRTELQSALASD